jgi:hypothetical protein
MVSFDYRIGNVSEVFIAEGHVDGLFSQSAAEESNSIPRHVVLAHLIALSSLCVAR